MDYYQFRQILNGNFDNIPKEKSKTVRIFLSSTFSDTHAERDHLLEHVYPKLKTYCKTNYGLDFQILDMRWGINSEITNSHLTTTICLHEIDTCQKYSAGPNFIAFLSHRYGSITLPTRIIKEEYELFATNIEANKDHLDLTFHYDNADDVHLMGASESSGGKQRPKISIENLFIECYQLDENETPARYKLKHLDRLLPGFDDKNPVYHKIWEMIETKLGAIFKQTAENLFKNREINETQYDRYFVSVTEKEIFNGILNNKNTSNTVLYFQRNIVDIDEYAAKNLAIVKKFIDLDKEDRVDKASRALLDELKNVKIPSKLSSSNIFKYDVKFDEKYGISKATHASYLNELGKTFYEQVKRLIDKGQELKTETAYLSDDDSRILQEVLDHANFCNNTVEKFHGRDDLLAKIKEYLLSDSACPFIIHGASGCGKTAILAKITSDIIKVVPDPQNYTIILRFMGTTPLSSNIINVFNTLIYQLSKLFDLKVPDKIVPSKNVLRELLYMQLEAIAVKHPTRKIVIVLDSIDQLHTSDYSLDWFIDTLPFNIKMIYSTLPDHGEILNRLKKIDTLPQTNFLEITSLNADLATLIIQDWLKKSKRRISAQQDQVVRSMLDKNKIYPLYVKIIFDIISKWTSYYEPDAEFEKVTTIDKCIEYLFKTLEVTHGKLLFSRSVIYLTSFKNGISESELEDILSLDDEVLYDIFEFHSPPSRRLPSALWSRIKHDLKGYMVEKEIDDTRVIYWYHRRFIEVSNSYYISKLSSSLRQVIFGNVVDFFNETWKYTPKPYKYNEFLKRKLKLESGEAQQIRDTSMQPTVFVDPKSGTLRYNKRKITELPGFVSNMTSNIAVPMSCEHIYFNFHFLTGLFASVGFAQVFADFEQVNQTSAYSVSEEAKMGLKELKLMSLSFLQCGIQMIEFPSSAVTLVLYRTLSFYTYSKYFTKLIDEYDREALKLSSLILTNQIVAPPGNDLIFQFEKHSQPITHACIGADNDSLVFTLSNKLILFNMTTVIDLGEVELRRSDNDEPVLFFLVYFLDSATTVPLKDMLGGFVVATSTHLQSYGFDSTLYFSHDSRSKNILDIFLVNQFYVLAAYQDASTIDVFDLTSGEVKYSLDFAKNIKKIECNTHKQTLNDFKEKDFTELHMVVIFHDSSMDFYEMVPDETDKKKLTITKIRSMPSSGSEIVSFTFARRNHQEFDYDFFSCVYDDGTFVTGDSLDSLDELRVAKFDLMKSASSPPRLEINDIESSNILFLDKSTGHLVLLVKSDVNRDEDHREWDFFEIEGSFDRGVIVSDNQKVAGISLGTITFYVLSFGKHTQTEENKHQPIEISLIRVFEIDAHFDAITFLFNKDEMLLTCSRDMTMKVFVLNANMDRRENSMLEFDRSAKEIVSLHSLMMPTTTSGDAVNGSGNVEAHHVVAKLKNSAFVDVWDVGDGKIVNSIAIASENEFVADVFVKNNYLVTRLERESNTDADKKVTIRIFSYNLKNLSGKQAFKQKLNVDINYTHNYKLLDTLMTDACPSFNLFVLTESFTTKKIQIYQITEVKSNSNSNSSSGKESQALCSKKPVEIELESAYLADPSRSVIENSCITSSTRNYLVVFAHHSLLYFDTSSGQLVASKDLVGHEINLEYFLSPTNLFTNHLACLTPLANSNNVIALSNLNDLVFIEHINNDESTKTTTTTTTGSLNLIDSNNKHNRFDSFQVNTRVNAALALDKTNQQLVVFDLNVVARKLAFHVKNSILFTIDLNQNSKNALGKFGCDPNLDYIYLIEKKKILKIFTLDDEKKSARLTGEVPLYSEALDVTPTGDYISIAMQDRKVISFLIVDSKKPEQSLEKIKNLPRRNRKVDEKMKAKIQAILENSELLDSSDDEDDVEKLFEDESKKEKVLQKLAVMKLKSSKLILKKTKIEELCSNWETKYQASKSLHNNNKDFEIEKEDELVVSKPKPLKQENKTQNQDDSDLVVDPSAANLKKELNNALKNREPELKTIHTGKNVAVSNTNRVSTSRACSML